MADRNWNNPSFRGRPSSIGSPQPGYTTLESGKQTYPSNPPSSSGWTTFWLFALAICAVVAIILSSVALSRSGGSTAHPLDSFATSAIQASAYMDFKNLDSSSTGVYSVGSVDDVLNDDALGEKTINTVKYTHPLDKTSVWNTIINKKFDDFGKTAACYPTMYSKGSNQEFSASASVCNKEVFMGCAGNVDTVNVCFGDYMPSGSAGYAHVIGAEGAFLQNVNDVYAIVATGGVPDLNKFSDQMKTCWRALYDTVNPVSRSGTFDAQKFTVKTADGSSSITITESSSTPQSRFVQVVSNVFLAHLKTTPGSPYLKDMYLDLTGGSNVAHNANLDARLASVYNVMFSTKNTMAWDGVNPYFDEVLGIRCSDLRTSYLNPRGEDRVSTVPYSKNHGLSDVKCVYGTSPALFIYDKTTGARSEATTDSAKADAQHVGCAKDNSHHSDFNVKGFTVELFNVTNTDWPMGASWAVANDSPLKQMFDQSFSSGYNTEKAFPLFPGNDLVMKLKTSGVTKTDGTALTVDDYTFEFSVVQKVNDKYVKTSKQPAVTCPKPASGADTVCTMVIPKTTLPTGTVYIQLVAKHTASGGYSDNAELLPLLVLPFQSTPSFTPVTVERTTTASAPKASGTFNPENHISDLFVPYYAQMKLMLSSSSPSLAFPSSVFPTAVGAHELDSTTYISSRHMIHYACSNGTKVDVIRPCSDFNYAATAGTSIFKLWIFDMFGNGVANTVNVTTTA